ncbi:MAG TPA: UvrD-helicase domain-containing protein [Bryobacteraceae bacterium]|jgi:ATP-dependent exoDNAse (exonuclease V) beta subunit|nr:UvrD-helicase domain-containing protein [Bryobacteraceae bacterium]
MREVTLTADQLDAVDVSKRHMDACVVAGPGSGKTTVLVEYFHRLVAEGVDPLRILAITFTEKAAGNMRKKLAEAFQENPGVRARLERAWVSTVHGFCMRLLRENAVFAGVDPEFYVADERESWRLQQDSMAKAMDEVFRDRPVAVRALIRGLSSYEFEEAVLSAYDAMRGAGVPVEQLAHFPAPPGVTMAEIADTLSAVRGEPLSAWSHAQKQQRNSALESAERIVSAPGPREALRAIEEFSCNLTKCKRGTGAYNLLRRLRDLVEESQYGLITDYHAPQRRLLLEILCRFDRVYRERKSQAGALDFADLEEFTVRLLEEHAETRARLQAQFDHILMDEFQDTNGQQSKLLRLVRAPDRFYAVGDINQSIFGFRHAEPQGFQEYRDEVGRGGKRLVELIDNFRSRPEILSAVETITAGAEGIEPRSLVAGRRFDQPRPVSVELMAITADESMEAACVARRILELLDAEPEFQFKDVALLVRNTEVLSEFTSAFDQAGIPYLVNRGKGFYESREVNDLTHLLRVIANPRDEVSLAAVLRSPLAGVSDEALLQLKMKGDNIGASLMRLTAETATEFDPEDAGKLCRLVARLHEWRIRRESVSFDRLLMAAIDDCGYPESPNLDKFLAQARDAAPRMSLDAFVEELALVRASNPREPDAPPEDSANAVKVMTVHSAKGLEFPIVFLAALHKGIDASVPVVAFSRRFGLGARWRNPAKREDKDDLFQHAIRDERKARESEESNRLLYVAMTRAEQHLVLSFSGNGRKLANWAAVVGNRLHVDLDIPRDEIVTYTAPDGKPWNLRLLVGQVTDLPTERVRPSPLAPLRPELELLSPPAVDAQHDTNGTVTALSKFANCPREYYLGHYLGFEGRVRKLEEASPNGGLPAAEFGTQVHDLLAGTEVLSPDPEAVRLAGIFRQSPLGRRAARANRVEREFDFLMSVEEMVVHGQVDLWFEEGGELVIVDYKTDAVTAVEAHQRAQDYALQLRLYAQAVERIAGRPPTRAWLHFLRPNTAIPVDLTPSLLDSPEQVVRDFQEAQSRMEFPLNEGERCRRCPFFKGLCPAGYPV